MPNKDQILVLHAFKTLVYLVKTQFNVAIKVLFSDNDVSLGLDFALFAEDKGIQILHSA